MKNASWKGAAFVLGFSFYFFGLWSAAAVKVDSPDPSPATDNPGAFDALDLSAQEGPVPFEFESETPPPETEIAPAEEKGKQTPDKAEDEDEEDDEVDDEIAIQTLQALHDHFGDENTSLIGADTLPGSGNVLAAIFTRPVSENGEEFTSHLALLTRDENGKISTLRVFDSIDTDHLNTDSLWAIVEGLEMDDEAITQISEIETSDADCENEDCFHAFKAVITGADGVQHHVLVELTKTEEAEDGEGPYRVTRLD